MAPTVFVSGDIQAKMFDKRLTTMTASEKYSPSIIILNCARYLGSKLPLNNRAWRTFSCIDLTARGGEWTVWQVKENDTRNCWVRRGGGWGKSRRLPPPPPAPGKLKKMFTICVDFLLVF